MASYRSITGNVFVEAMPASETANENGLVDTKSGLVDVGADCWVLTHADGTVTLMHDVAFSANFEAAE